MNQSYISNILAVMPPVLTLTLSLPAVAALPQASIPLDISDTSYNTTPTSTSSDSFNQSAMIWADDTREEVQYQLNDWASDMNGWFGKPDPNDPASANLRIVLDIRWEDDPVAGSDWKIEPRVRGRLRLPVLEEQLSLIIGDEALDEEDLIKQDVDRQRIDGDVDNDKVYDKEQSRKNNASIALRWSQFEDAFGIDADLGVRSGDDIYFKLSTERILLEQPDLTVTSHNYYRYSIDTEHSLKGELNIQYVFNPSQRLNHNSHIDYRHKSDTEETSWSNAIRQIHYLNHNKQLSYGVSYSGFISSKDNKPVLNSYGPALSYRQPFWREWLFLQTDLSYFNNKHVNKDHFSSALVRLEALF